MMSSKNLFALKISRLIASAGSLALSILPCSIGSRGARLNGFHASCALAGLARTEPSKPALIQWAGERTRRATRRDNDGRARRVGRNILPAGAHGGQMTWDVVIMFSRTICGEGLGAPMNRKRDISGRRGACRRGRFDRKPTSSTQCMSGIDLPMHNLESVKPTFRIH
jgi:hypothetical protein